VRVALASFGVVFLGEWGDITQITTANLAARYGDPFSVGLGALLALWSVSALALTVGRGLVARVPTRLVRRLTGTILAVLAVVTLVEAIRARPDRLRGPPRPGTLMPVWSPSCWSGTAPST